jgi:hypothetical protein
MVDTTQAITIRLKGHNHQDLQPTKPLLKDHQDWNKYMRWLVPPLNQYLDIHLGRELSCCGSHNCGYFMSQCSACLFMFHFAASNMRLHYLLPIDLPGAYLLLQLFCLHLRWLTN